MKKKELLTALMNYSDARIQGRYLPPLAFTAGWKWINDNTVVNGQTGEAISETEIRLARSLDKATQPVNELTDEPETTQATDILQKAIDCIGDRASERDTDAERSMKAAVESFNAMYGTELTEEQGWMFMVFLKASRAKGGDYREDDYTDGASYFGLAGEAAAKERG